jgi:hypothetical protein
MVLETVENKSKDTTNGVVVRCPTSTDSCHRGYDSRFDCKVVLTLMS